VTEIVLITVPKPFGDWNRHFSHVLFPHQVLPSAKEENQACFLDAD
jgi:hypothetical protein